MAYLKKAEAEKLFVEEIKKIGFESYSVMNGEGRALNNLYYCFVMKNGTQRFWTNLSEYALNALGLNEKG